MKTKRIYSIFMISIIALTIIGTNLIIYGIRISPIVTHSNQFETESIDGSVLSFIGHPSTIDISSPDSDAFKIDDPTTETLWYTSDGIKKYPTESVFTRGSRINLLNEKGEFRVEPIVIQDDIENDYNEIMKKKSEIIEYSYYENSWRGEPAQDGTEHYEIVIPRPSNWNINQIGIAWCSFYLSYETLSLELGGNWALTVYGGSNDYPYYLGWRTPSSPYNIGMPFVTRSLLREYVYDIYASNDYYEWYTVAMDLHSYQIEKTFNHDPIRNPSDDPAINPTRSEYPIGTGWDDTWIANDPTAWLSRNPYPYSGYMSPTGEWQDESWNDIEYIDIPSSYQSYKYFKIVIKDIILDDGIGMFGTDDIVAPEIGEIIFNYSINIVSSNPYDYYNGYINSPINNSWHQVSPYDTIPIEVGIKGLTPDITNDETIDQITFYVDGNEDDKVLLFSNDNDITISPPSLVSYPVGNWENIQNIWNTTEEGYYLSSNDINRFSQEKQSETNIEDPYIKVTITPTETEWSSLYDVGVVISDIGETEQHIVVNKDFEGTDTPIQGDYINYEIINPLNTPSNSYTKNGTLLYDNTHVKILDHELSVTKDNDSKAIYDYEYDDLYYSIYAPDPQGPSLNHTWMTYTNLDVPNDTAWRVTPNYGLSLSFNYGYIANDIIGWNEYVTQGIINGITVTEKSYQQFITHTFGDNFLFLSFKFVAHNGDDTYTNGIPHYALLLISGDPSTTNNLTVTNYYKMFIDKKTSEGMIYIDEFASMPSEEKQIFTIKNFENLCDYIVEKYDLDMFTDSSDYSQWCKVHGYEISDIKFYSILNSHRFKLLGEGYGTEDDFYDQYSVTDFCPIDRSVTRYIPYFYYDENNNPKWRVYGEVENLESMNDTIYIDNITLVNTPKSYNCFTNVYASMRSEYFIGYGPNNDAYTMNDEKNPKIWLPLKGEPKNVFEHYDRIKDFYHNDLLLKIGSVILQPNKVYTMNIGVLSSYSYSQNTISNKTTLSQLWQPQSIIIKKIVLIPRVLHVNEINNFDYASYNSIDPFYTSYYSEDDEKLGKAVIIRNAFSDAYTVGYEKDFRLESTVTTSLYNDDPKEGDYVEITLNFPVSTHYDLYLRDSLIFNHVSDHNRYTVSIDGNIYRRYVQDYDGLIGNDDYHFYQSYVGSLQTYQDDLADNDLVKLLHIASDYFTAGKHTLKITFDGFQSYRYYDTTQQKIVTTYDDFSRIRYNQIVMYYKSNSSYELPVSYFQKLNPYSHEHNITTEITINDNYVDIFGGKKTLTFTTYFGLEVKPIINFAFGSLNDYIAEFYGGNIEGDINQIYQQQYITNLEGIYNLTTYIYANTLDNSTIKYRINRGEWKDFDHIENDYSVLIKARSTLSMSNYNIKLGKNIIEVTASTLSGDTTSSYLVFYYDPNPPEIEIIDSTTPQGGIITEEGWINVTLHITDEEGIIDRICYTTGLQSTWDLNSYRSGINLVKNAEIPVFDKDLDRRETQDITINISIPVTEIEQGFSTLSFIAQDLAKNIKVIDFPVNKVSELMKIDFPKPEWRYVATDVPLQFNATNYILEGSDWKYFSSHSIHQKWVQLGYGDSPTIFNKIEHKFVATEESLTKIGFVFQTPLPELKDFPAMIEIKHGEKVLSRGYMYPSSLPESLSMYGGIRYIDIPDIILTKGETYTIVITPFGSPYNIMNLKIGIFSDNENERELQREMYGETFGYYKGIKIPLNGYVLTVMYGKTPVPKQQAGDVYYSLNGDLLEGPFPNGIINTTLSVEDQQQGYNHIKIYVDNGGGYYQNFDRYYLWVSKDYHSPPKAEFLSPSPGSDQKGNITIEIQYDYPEYNETYNIQFFIKGENMTWTWIGNITIEEFTKENITSFIFNTNVTIDGIPLLNDSANYQFMAYIDDGYDTYRAYSGIFTINNYGPFVSIISPSPESRWNYNVKIMTNVTVYGSSYITKAWIFYNNDPTNYFNLISRTFTEKDGERIYYFEYIVPLDQISSGANTINFYVEDQYGRIGEDSAEIIKDTDVFIEIEDITPTVPNPYEDTAIYYTIFDDYKKIDIYISYSESYGKVGFKKIATMEKENITGSFSLGKLNVGTYSVILTVEDEAGNLWTDERNFTVTETGVLKSISENIASIFSILAGIFSLAIVRKMMKTKKANPLFYKKFKIT